jgi:hypothetical protein
MLESFPRVGEIVGKAGWSVREMFSITLFVNGVAVGKAAVIGSTESTDHSPGAIACSRARDFHCAAYSEQDPTVLCRKSNCN